jgi:S1-C subfamily serine protease
LEGVDLQTGDVLQSLNGQKITGVSQFTESFEKLAVGVKVELQYLRSDKTLTAAFNKPQTSGRVMIRTNDN